MKRKWNKVMAMALTGVMSASLLAGCGNASNGTDDNSTSTDIVQAETTESTSNDGKTHIEFFNQKTEIVDILQGLIAEYESENPDIKIDLVTPADSSTVLTSRMASNDTPDVFTHWPSATFFAAVDSGYVMDLSDTGIMDNIQDAAREQWKHDGGEYAATLSYNCSGIWVNEELFEQAGITEKPTTWSELMDDCEKLQSAGITPFVTVGKQTDITDRILQVYLASSMGSAYQEFEDDAAAKTVDASAAYAASLKSMAEKMVQMVGYSQDDVMGTDQDSATANFANGQGAMMLGGSWLNASITAANPDVKISMMPIPGDTTEETNTCAYPGDMALCIAKDSDVSDAAIAFVKWMTSPEIATKYAEKEGNPSCINDVTYVAEPLEELYANYVTTGKFILNPDCNWTKAQQDAAGAAIQQLYYDQDTDSFAENLAAAFNDN